MSLLTPTLSAQRIFPTSNRPITMGRVGEFRRMVDRHHRMMQEASGVGHQTQYIANMHNQVRMVKARIHQRIDLIG